MRKAGTSYFWVCGFGCGFSGVNSYSADGVVFILQCTQDCSSLWKAFISMVPPNQLLSIHVMHTPTGVSSTSDGGCSRNSFALYVGSGGREPLNACHL